MISVGSAVIRVIKDHDLGYPIGTIAEVIGYGTPGSDGSVFYNVKLLTGHRKGKISVWDARFTEVYNHKIIWEV